MNIYIELRHHRPILYGSTDADVETAKMQGFEVGLFLHQGGAKEWAICLRQKDDPSELQGWHPYYH
jgi:hypothetical protein